MNPRILVVLTGLALLCAAIAQGQQTSPTDKAPPDKAAVASSGTEPGSGQAAGPSVSVGPDQVRPANAQNEPNTAPAGQPAARPAGGPAEPVPNPNSPKRAASKLPPQAAGPMNGDAHPYIVGPLDVLEIRVWNDPKLSGMYPVRPDGMISIPLIGEMRADGLSVPALSDALKQRLNSVMNDPEVNIQVAKINSKRVFVFGGVMKPGEMPLYENMTVLDALSNVGFKDFANPKKITIMRGNQIFHFNYKEVSKGKHMEQNIYLQNGDRIFVPE